MASRKVKHARMMEKRAKWENEVKERGLKFLKAEQTRRAEENRKKEEQIKDRKIKTSKRLAKAHNAAKSGKSEARQDNPIRKKHYQEARGQVKESI